MAVKQQSIPDALKYFDELPASAGVDAEVVGALLSCGVLTVWRMAADGRLPKPRKLSGRMTRWNVGELRKAISTMNAEPMRKLSRIQKAA